MTGFTQTRSSFSADPLVKYIKFYPNPAISTINFEFPKDYDNTYSFNIYNFIGKKVFAAKQVISKMNISLTDFSRGVYIYELRDKTGNIIESGKFQVIK